MKNNLKNIFKGTIAIAASALVFSSCNKDLDTFPPIPTPVYPSNTTSNVGASFANANDTLFYRLLVKSGLLPLLSDSSRRFTIFAPTDSAMRRFCSTASGGALPAAGAPQAAYIGFINANLPASSAAGIVQYYTVGQLYPSSAIPLVFPNFPLPGQIQLDPVANPFIRTTLTVAKGSPNTYLNSVKLSVLDIVASNGIIHKTDSLQLPPAPNLLRNALNARTNLSYFRAALLRADSGQVVKPNNDSTNFLNYFMGYGILNMTVLAPNDAAFQTFIYSVAFGRTLQALGVTPATATPAQLAAANSQGLGAVAAGPAFLASNNVTTTQVRGIIAYHLLASANSLGTIAPNIRTFSVNVPTTPALVKTLVNSSAASAAHPGVRAVATYMPNGYTSSVTFTGFASLTGGAPFTDTPANVLEKDVNTVNGVLHVIDRVMLPLGL
jgi:uncharacterized surface protein with fasciclin (FAS1) repeats